jgi:hypothetical protein
MKSNMNVYLPLLTKYSSTHESDVLKKTAKQMIEYRLKSKEHILYMITRDLYEDEPSSARPADDPMILANKLLKKKEPKNSEYNITKKNKKNKKDK